MSNRKTTRRSDQVTVDQLQRCLRSGALTTKQVCERLNVTSSHASNLLKACPGVHRGKIGAQKHIWSLG